MSVIADGHCLRSMINCEDGGDAEIDELELVIQRRVTLDVRLQENSNAMRTIWCIAKL